MIIEAIVSTCSKEGAVNFAPMGLQFPQEGRIALCPYRSSVTYQNLSSNPSGVFNLLTEATLFVKCALLDYIPGHCMSERVAGGLMDAADEVIEFTIDTVDNQSQKSLMSGPIVSRTALKTPQAGFNRGRGVVIEALIAVTRIGILSDEEIRGALKRSRLIVGKTGGPAELEAMSLIERHYERHSG